jgi:hypothetical protein
MANKSALSFPRVPMPVWRELLEASLAFRAARPWELMCDADNFALIDDQQLPWFPAVLGGAGQVFGLALYRGAGGLRYLLDGVGHVDEMSPDVMFLQDALLMDWGTKNALEPEELKILTQLGYAPKPHDRLGWPSYRSHVPGLYPWPLTEKEARELTTGIRATLACYALVAKRPDFFAPGEAEGRLFPTVSIRDALSGQLHENHIEWRHWQLPPPEIPASPVPGPGWLSTLLALPQKPNFTLEFDDFYSTEPVADGTRPYFPRVSLMADGKSGYIYGMEMSGSGTAWGKQILSVWSKAIFSARSRPETICIQRGEWMPALQPLADSLGIRLKLKDALPFISEARASLEQFARSRR